MNIEYSNINNPTDLMVLYQKISKYSGTLARDYDECNLEYFEMVITKSSQSGLNIAAYNEGVLIAFIYSYKFDLKFFNHTLANITIGVDPEYQGQGIGKELMKRFMSIVEQNKSIQRVELFTPETNKNAIKLYERFGFKKEGIFRNRAICNGNIVNDIPMAWIKSQGDLGA